MWGNSVTGRVRRGLPALSIGLAYSLPQLRDAPPDPGLGTAVLLTTALVAVLLWLAGQPPVLAFVVGAVFAQSSSHHRPPAGGAGRGCHGAWPARPGHVGVQDVTAVPFVILIPVLGAATGMEQLAGELGWAAAKAVLPSPWSSMPRAGLAAVFHLVAERRSAELFTLTVLLVVLLAA
jgi:CPA2 family monovalent cation:H+ antiporter-2